MSCLDELLQLASVVLDVVNLYRQVHERNDRHALPALREKLTQAQILSETAVLLDNGPTVEVKP